MEDNAPKKIAIDIDEVQFEFMNPFAKWHNKTHNTNWNPNDLISYNMWETWGGTKEEAIQKVFQFYNTNDFSNLKPISGAFNAISTLSKEFQICNITARPLIVKEKTIQALNKHFPMIKEDNVYFASNFYENGNGKKSAICKQVNASMMIEDSLEYAIDCASNGIFVILLNRPWNRSETLPENIIRAQTWEEVPKIVEDHFHSRL